MAGSNQYKASEFIEAIPGTGGIISTIARRVGCDWHTAKKYIDTYPTVNRAYEDERERVTDLAESVLVQNIKLAYKKQEDTKEPVDSSDAKWYLTRKGKSRGYTERQEITGAEGGPLVVGNVQLTESQRTRALRQLAEIHARAAGEEE